MEDISNIGVYDYGRRKMCDLYDSQVKLVGQAYNIDFIENKDGVNTLTFCIPYMTGEEENVRWQFMKNEYLIRLYRNGKEPEWFVANKPVKKKAKDGIVGTVSCNGTPILLKTKNIYQEFDDENGIGTIRYVMEQILKGTGWHLGYCEVLMEADGETEKIRSLQATGNTGALGLINNACDLFQCRPIYHTETQTVDILGVKTRDMLFEAEVGRNLNSLQTTFTSDDIITRLYVEGEYGDHGYVGIDDVNPTGLSYLMDFDYYREIGVFTEEHEAALAEYLPAIQDVVNKIRKNRKDITKIEDQINELIGQCKLIVFYDEYGYESPTYVYGDPTDEQKHLAVGDEVLVLQEDGEYRHEVITSTPEALIHEGDYGIAKFATPSAGVIGAGEVSIEAKEKQIANLEKRKASTVKEDKIAEYEKEIERLNDEIDLVYYGVGYADDEMRERMAQDYIPSGYDGNADMVNRKIVPAQNFIDKGYTDFNGTYGTIYSQSFSAGATEDYDFSYGQNVIIDATCVKANGAVLSESELETYLRGVVSNSTSSGATLMECDSQDLILRVDPVAKGETPDQAFARSGAWCIELHNMQASWDRVRASYDWFGDEDIDPAGILDDVTRVRTEGIYSQMARVVGEGGLLDELKGYISIENMMLMEQDEIEATFIVAMGDLLRDGKWQNNNYVVGQEEALYADAMDRMKIMSRPKAAYTFSYVRMMEEYGVPNEKIKINAIMRIHDDDLNVHANLFVTRITTGIDRKNVGNIEVSTEDITLGTNDLGSLLSRMSQLADLIEQKNAIYNRAEAISKSGTFFADRLNGMIDVTRNKILSSVSNWYTDDQGNMVFVSADESSAMMLTGSGQLLSDRKNEDGSWDWRTAIDGHGICADEIITGFLSADRIESGSIAVSKVEPNFGSELIITGNPAISDSAREFDETIDYHKNDVVVYDGVLYMFTEDKPAGEWDPSCVVRTSITTQITLMPDRILQYVGEEGYYKTYIQPTDPSLDPGFDGEYGCYWIQTDKNKQKINTWRDLSTVTWGSLADTTWGVLRGYLKIMCWDGTKWMPVYDAYDMASAHTKIEQNKYEIKLEAERRNKLEGDLRTEISITADSITQTVKENYATKATLQLTAGGKITLTSENFSHLGASTSGIYITPTSISVNTNGSMSIGAGGAMTVSASGALNITGGTMSVTANGSLTIGANGSLTVNGGSMTLSAGTMTISGGSLTINGGTFSLTSTYFNVATDGRITCTGGTIGGFTIGANSLTAGSNTSKKYVQVANSGFAFAAGKYNTTAEIYPFCVDLSGNVWISSLKVKKSSSEWEEIDFTKFDDDDGFDKLKYQTVKSVKTEGDTTTVTLSNGASFTAGG